MQFVQIDTELVNHLPHDRHGHLTCQRVKHSIKRASGPIVVEAFDFIWA